MYACRSTNYWCSIVLHPGLIQRKEIRSEREQRGKKTRSRKEVWDGRFLCLFGWFFVCLFWFGFFCLFLFLIEGEKGYLKRETYKIPQENFSSGQFYRFVSLVYLWRINLQFHTLYIHPLSVYSSLNYLGNLNQILQSHDPYRFH